MFLLATPRVPPSLSEDINIAGLKSDNQTGKDSIHERRISQNLRVVHLLGRQCAGWKVNHDHPTNAVIRGTGGHLLLGLHLTASGRIWPVRRLFFSRWAYVGHSNLRARRRDGQGMDSHRVRSVARLSAGYTSFSRLQGSRPSAPVENGALCADGNTFGYRNVMELGGLHV